MREQRGQQPFTMNTKDRPLCSLSLYHASDKNMPIQEIQFPGPRENCDFGPGFYLTDNKFTSEEWVFEEDKPIINKYDFLAPLSSILHLTDEDWIRVVVGYRTGKYKVHFYSPVVKGIIANDRLVPSMELFLSGVIGDKRLKKSLDYCKLGDQFLLRENTSFLSNHSSKPLTGGEKQQAAERFKSRRQGMGRDLTLIQRESIAGEKYIEDYLAMGDYHEPTV